MREIGSQRGNYAVNAGITRSTRKLRGLTRIYAWLHRFGHIRRSQL